MGTRRDRSLLTTQEAADALALSPDSVARMCDAGEIPSTRTAGGHRRIPREHIEQLAAFTRPEPIAA